MPVQQEIEIHDHAPASKDGLAGGEDECAAHNDKCQDDGNGPVEPVTAECLFVHGDTSLRDVEFSLPRLVDRIGCGSAPGPACYAG